MVEIPLTSYVVDGQTKWTVMSERKEGNNGDKSRHDNLWFRCEDCDFKTRKKGYLKKQKSPTNATIVVTQHPSSVTCGRT